MFGSEAQSAAGGFHAETSSSRCPMDVLILKSSQSIEVYHRHTGLPCHLESALFNRVSGMGRMPVDGWHSADSPSVDQCILTFTSHYGLSLVSPKRQKCNLRASKKQVCTSDTRSRFLTIRKCLFFLSNVCQSVD